MKFPACQQLNGQWFFCFQNIILHSLFIVGCVECLHFQQSSHCYGTWKATQKLVFFQFSALQSYFQHLESFSIISQLKKNLMQACQNHKWNNTHLYLCSVVSSWKLLSKLQCTPSGRSSCLQHSIILSSVQNRAVEMVVCTSGCTWMVAWLYVKDIQDFFCSY